MAVQCYAIVLSKRVTRVSPQYCLYMQILMNANQTMGDVITTVLIPMVVINVLVTMATSLRMTIIIVLVS